MTKLLTTLAAAGAIVCCVGLATTAWGQMVDKKGLTLAEATKIAAAAEAEARE